MDDSLTEHRAILAAIRLRDADRAAELTAAHIRVPAQRLQAALDDDAEASDPADPAGPAGPAAPDSEPAGLSRG
jgi:hypothetical protein